MILGDPHALHRDPFSGEPLPGNPEWTPWDYALVNAVQLIEDYTNASGLLAWDAEDDRVDVQALRKVDKFEAAKHRTTNRKNYKEIPGEYFIPRTSLIYDDDEWPTFGEWVQSQRNEEDPPPEPEVEYASE